MPESFINRSEKQIDKDTFRHLMDLCLRYSWLQTRPEALYELWMLADSDVQKDLIDFLLNNFRVVENDTLSTAADEMARKVNGNWELPQDKTVISAVCDDTKPDGSQFILQVLKNKFAYPWREQQFYNSITHGVNNIPQDGNIVLVDDFIGTGDTISRKVKYVNRVVSDKKKGNVRIYILTLAAMRFSESLIRDISADYFSAFWQLKGITESTEEPLRTKYISAMEDMEKKLEKEIRGKKIPNFGYKRSEALFCIGDLNVPNNVFPIFWWPCYEGGLPRDTLFRRI